MNQRTDSTQIITQFGVLNIDWEGPQVKAINMGNYETTDRRINVRHIPGNPASLALINQVLAYFKGEKIDFATELPDGVGTPLQRKVWTALRMVPYGKFITYGILAKKLKLPLSRARVLGNVCAQNPQPILFPCHRIVASTGALTGYVAGIQWKKALLELEGIPVKHGRIPFRTP